MSRGIRCCALAVGTAAFLSAQVAYAAPAVPAAPMTVSQQMADPLVSLSMLGSPQSRAAVMPAAMASSAATTAVQPAYVDGRPRVNPLLIALGVVLFIAVIVAIATSGNDDSEGNLTPVSPD